MTFIRRKVLESAAQVYENQYMDDAGSQYEKLLQEVRMRRHALKNQLGAVVSADIPDEKTSRYLEELQTENRYNDLLLCGDEIIAGLFYQKCMEAQEKEIPVEYHIRARIAGYGIARTSLVGMLGVLLDNAIEAEMSLAREDRGITFSVEYRDEGFLFEIGNRFPYVPYAQIEQWFEPGKTTKGTGHGIGLAYVRSLCEESGCEIGCRNLEEDGVNRIVFTLYIHRQEEGEKEKKDRQERKRNQKKEHPAFKVPKKILLLIFFPVLMAVSIVWNMQKELPERTGADAAVSASDLPEAEKPYLLYLADSYYADDGGDPGELIEEEDLGFFKADRTVLAAVEYFYLDEEGRCVRKERFVRSGYDSEEDGAVLREIGMESVPAQSKAFFRRVVEKWAYDAAGQISNYEEYRQYKEDEEPRLVEARKAGELPPDMDNSATQQDTEKDRKQGRITEIRDARGNKIRSFYEKDGVTYPGYYASADDAGRVTVEFDYEPNTEGEPDSWWQYRYRMYSSAKDGNGQPVFAGYYFAEEDTFFLEGYSYEPVICENRNVFRAYSYDENGRMKSMLELYPFRGYGNVSVYAYHDGSGEIVKYEYRIFANSSDAFTWYSSWGRVLFMENYEEAALYEYSGAKITVSRYTIREIVCEDAKGDPTQKYQFSDGYPTKTILQDGEEILWE